MPEIAKGLKGKGAVAVSDYYDRLIANKEVMEVVDALNQNAFRPLQWLRHDGRLDHPQRLDSVRFGSRKIDAANYRSKKILSSESWIVWDGAGTNTDVNGDGKKDERDAFDKTVTIFGKMLERGLNTINMPWCDNSSSWSMGLVKRVDYNGRIKKLQPGWVVPSNDGGPDAVTRKVGLRGSADENFQPVEVEPSGRRFTEKITPTQATPIICIITFGSGTANLPAVRTKSSGMPLPERMATTSRFSGPVLRATNSTSFPPTTGRKKFIVLLYAGGAGGTSFAKVTLPSTIQDGKYYNNEFSSKDFRGEGFKDGQNYQARIVTKDISRDNGSDLNRSEEVVKPATVTNGQLTVNEAISASSH